MGKLKNAANRMKPGTQWWKMDWFKGTHALGNSPYKGHRKQPMRLPVKMFPEIGLGFRAPQKPLVFFHGYLKTSGWFSTENMENIPAISGWSVGNFHRKSSKNLVISQEAVTSRGCFLGVTSHLPSRTYTEADDGKCLRCQQLQKMYRPMVWS